MTIQLTISGGHYPIVYYYWCSQPSRADGGHSLESSTGYVSKPKKTTACHNAEKRCDLIQLIEGVPQGIGRVSGDSRVDVKHFVLDTNVLLHNPNAIFLLAD